jgi:glycosyltransferase involved in cell wall biosynthesis
LRGYVVGGAIYDTQKSQHTIEDLRTYARNLGLDGKIGFTGFVENVPAALRSLDIVVHASTEPEPFGLVIVEGMASGKAVISASAGGAAELVDDGLNALTHPPGDALTLAKRIDRLASDPELRSNLGQAARRWVESKFDRDDLASHLLPIYRQIASQ